VVGGRSLRRPYRKCRSKGLQDVTMKILMFQYDIKYRMEQEAEGGDE